MNDNNQVKINIPNYLRKEVIKWSCIYLISLLCFCSAIIISTENIIIQIATLIFSAISSILIPLINCGATGMFDNIDETNNEPKVIKLK